MKSITPFLSIVLLFAYSCTKEKTTEPARVNSLTQDALTEDTTTHYVGEHFGGGIVILVTHSGKHGLIADTADLGKAAWWNGANIFCDATATAIGTGRENTRKIIVAQGKKGTYAALLCAKSVRAGFTDWFLPSKDELNEIYKHKDFFNNLTVDNYTCSSEVDFETVWGEYLNTGYQWHTNKQFSGMSVRAVRYF